MKITYSMCKFSTYLIFSLVSILIVFYMFTLNVNLIREKSINNENYFYEKININSNKIDNNKDFIEGFIDINSSSKDTENDDIYNLIKRKLKSLQEEIGGTTGSKQIKELLINTKKISDLECAKCMINMVQDNKGVKSIDIENILSNEDNENCVKCKKYTELSSTIKNMIDGL